MRVFGKFPGAGCVKPGEAWEEGLKERKRRCRKAAKKGGKGADPGAGGDFAGYTSDSGLSACVEVTKPKRRKHAPAIVRITVKYRAVGSGKKKRCCCEIDTRAAMWEICEGVRRVTGVHNVITLVSERLKRVISSPYDVADGDVIAVGVEQEGIGGTNGNTFSRLGRQPMSYVRR